jgi:hypothetical protein
MQHPDAEVVVKDMGVDEGGCYWAEKVSMGEGSQEGDIVIEFDLGQEL